MTVVFFYTLRHMGMMSYDQIDARVDHSVSGFCLVTARFVFTFLTPVHIHNDDGVVPLVLVDVFLHLRTEVIVIGRAYHAQ